jgi:hypothetical protein
MVETILTWVESMLGFTSPIALCYCVEGIKIKKLYMDIVHKRKRAVDRTFKIYASNIIRWSDLWGKNWREIIGKRTYEIGVLLVLMGQRILNILGN